MSLLRKLFIFSSFVLLSFWCFANVGPRHQTIIEEESTEAIISYAKAYRQNKNAPPAIEDTRQKNVLEKLFRCLKKYDDHISLNEAVKSFVNDYLVIDNFELINASLTDIGGKSDDTVFLIKNGTGQLCYVVKAFRNPQKLSSKFVPEISALEFIQMLALPSVASVKPLAFGAYSNEKEEWGLLLETVAQGQRVDQYIYQLGEYELNSIERENYIRKCQKIFQKLGRAFAELHSKRSLEPFSIPAHEIEKYHQKISIILGNSLIVEELEKKVSIDDFLSSIKKIEEQAVKEKIFFSYWHGDAHLGNIFYDFTNDNISFIDVAKLHYSVSEEEEPMIDGTIDLIRVEENLRRISLGLLTEDEIETLLQAFFEEYNKHSVHIINQNVFLFHRTNKKLGRLVTYARYVEDNGHLKLDPVFIDAVEYFSK